MDKLDQQLQANIRGDFELGWKLVQELEIERPHCNRCAFNRGWMLLQRGELKKGFDCLARGRWERVFGSPPLLTDKPIWKPGTICNRILLRGEGGLGDEIVNARFAKPLQAYSKAEIVVSCAKPLMPIFKRIEGVYDVVERNTEQDTEFDYWVPAMSAPTVLNYEYKNITGKPYLTTSSAPEYDLRSVTNRLRFNVNDDFQLSHNLDSTKLKIGIRWSGNPAFEHQQHRVFDKHKLISLAEKYSGKGKGRVTKFYSFQRDMDLVTLPSNIVDLRDNLPDWETTLAYLNSMDLVITSCTSIAHASAALGVPTWVITPILPYYVWALPGNKSPWYDSVTLFRQEQYDNWDSMFVNLEQELSKFIKEISN